ncbi:MoaD/ThiS family protein [Gordonia sp. HY002]|uniref:MoaD/ThiS family protein n=1 Tax=Gordonia zhenghanii TaxID=2911516 RepID=UPI001EF122B7|nr:MoaD/ThiS family protein [Gordonia zhenghanii]MCF8571760.1 MoaD/ThiS family protein [Gordonia zhenghanii]MCF8604915.1 MoaD/ThiS family protein [Gordonia zhenghanii]
MKIRYFAGAADAAGRRDQEFDGPLSLAALRAALADEHGPEFAAVLGRCSLMVDGVRTDDTAVAADSSTVDVLPPFAGG